MTYLGTQLPPDEYYQVRGQLYVNGHQKGILALLPQVTRSLSGKVLDLGCGDGLVTSWALLHRPDLLMVGADRSPVMAARYEAQTGAPCTVAKFTESLPTCDGVIACYSLHLLKPGERALTWWRLRECGAQTVVILSPFEDRPPPPQQYFSVVSRLCQRQHDQRAVFSWVCHPS